MKEFFCTFECSKEVIKRAHDALVEHRKKYNACEIILPQGREQDGFSISLFRQPDEELVPETVIAEFREKYKEYEFTEEECPVKEWTLRYSPTTTKDLVNILKGE